VLVAGVCHIQFRLGAAFDRGGKALRWLAVGQLVGTIADGRRWALAHAGRAAALNHLLSYWYLANATMKSSPKPIRFKVNKAVGGGIMPQICSDTYAVAYQDERHFIALPFDNPFTAGKEYYFQAPRNSRSLHEFVEDCFSGTEIVEMKLNAGDCMPHVWRPGRRGRDEIAIKHAIDPNFRSDKQALLLLVLKLAEIFQYVEPTKDAFSSYGHKIRELHILSCTEVENYFQQYLAEAVDGGSPKRPSTNDYVRMKDALYLEDHCIIFPQYPELELIQAFDGWSVADPTKTLSWYQAYNLSKHNRKEHFNRSTLHSVILSTAAAVTLFAVRYGHGHLLQGDDHLSAQLAQILRIGLSKPDPTTWYVPKVVPRPGVEMPMALAIEKFHPWRNVEFRIGSNVSSIQKKN
jgi:hypothetical protein